MVVKLIVAMCKNNGIGCDNKIPWRIPEDMNYFYKKTSGSYGMFMRNKNIKEKYMEDLSKSDNIKKNVVIMGNNTWESLPKKYKPLPYRFNIVLSKNATSLQPTYSLNKDIVFSSSIDDAMSLYYGKDNRCEKGEKGEKGEKREKGEKGDKTNIPIFNNIWVIGGSSVYLEFMRRNFTSDIKISKYYITYIDKNYECDTYFPLLENMNKYCLTRFEKHKCIDNNRPNELPLNIYFIVFKKIEYIDENIIQQLFISYKSKNESKSNLTLYIRGRDRDKFNMNNTDDFEILFSIFCS